MTLWTKYFELEDDLEILLQLNNLVLLFCFLCSLLYGSEDPSISGMVLDSAFSNLFDLMMELVDVYKIRLPKFTVCIISLQVWCSSRLVGSPNFSN